MVAKAERGDKPLKRFVQGEAWTTQLKLGVNERELRP